MRIIVASIIVVVTVLAAVVLTRINILTPRRRSQPIRQLPNPQWLQNHRRRPIRYRR
jgi:hypothetical protein